MSAYQDLEKRFARISALNGASSMLHWDSATMLPQGAMEVRGEQLAVLAELSHEQVTAPELADLLAQAVDEHGALSNWQQANLREMQHRWKHENAVPAELVGAFVRATSASEAKWRSARGENDYAGFAPYLEEVLRLVREVAQAKAQAFQCSPYDALLDGYDPGTRSAQVDTWFADLAAFLPEFTGRATEKQASETAPIPPQGPFPIEAQKRLGIAFMEKLGFDFNAGRLDVSLHPFCGGVPGDVRLTTRYREENFTESFFGVLHETGHALYEMGLPAAWRTQPVGQARGMSTHESQSLFVEMQLSRGKDFLRYAAPIICEMLGAQAAFTPENLRALVTRVRPGFIRTSADEVTYPSHVILRYRLEKAMVEDDLQVRDLPGAWADGMQALLGITPPTDTEGCMQDIHWPDGAFGYFPTYTMGAMLAAQLYAAAEEAIPTLSEQIRVGDFTALFAFLRTRVHAQASLLETPALAEHATGKPLGTEAFKAHLQKRYLGE